jgi:hypothetical protein
MAYEMGKAKDRVAKHNIKSAEKAETFKLGMII